MGPYSHYVLAAKLESAIHPENRNEYFWGAVAPDIRYLANMRRDQTHVVQEQIKELMVSYPELRSFLMGYQIHLLCDQVDITQIVNSAFPLNLLNQLRRKRFSSQQMIVLVEMFYLQTEIVGVALSGEHNDVFSNLGISAEQTHVFHQALQDYFDQRSAEGAIAAFQKIGWIQNNRVEKYMSVYLTMKKQKVLNSLLMLGIKNARLDARITAHVQSRIAR
jgi:hypothetical protein